MKSYKILIITSAVFLIISSAALVSAGDFDWIKDLNIQAQADLSGFRATLSTRFHIGDAEINAVLTNVTDPADAYMVLRLGEMSSKPADFVIEQYKSGKNKGWGALARSLGIKPGSKEFEALKLGSDISNDTSMNKNKDNGKGKAKNKK
jgi:hypothetical protein